MPAAAPRPCRYPGCSALGQEGYCEKHRRKVTREQDLHRGSRHERGYTNAWTRASKAFLQKHPLCALCIERNRIEAAQLVDHWVPHKGDMQLFWDENNWVPLSRTCHSSTKQALEAAGYPTRMNRPPIDRVARGPRGTSPGGS